jgi:cell wall-associated NlpC family hydrolase
MHRQAHLLTIIFLLFFAVIMILFEQLVPLTIYRQAPRAVRLEAIEEGLALTGAAYRSGERGPERFDCSGLVVHIFRQALEGTTYQLPFDQADSAELARLHSRPVSKPEAGDLAFFQDSHGNIIHVAVLIEKTGTELHILEASSHSGEVSSRRILQSHSDLHSISRLKLIAVRK